MTDETNLCTMPPNYYGSYKGIVLEAFPAMDQVIERLLSLPPEEQQAWGAYIEWVGKQLQI